MAVVSIAISMSFHVKHQPTEFELRMAKPLGIVFWSLSVVMLFLGLGNYIGGFVFSFIFSERLIFCFPLLGRVVCFSHGHVRNGEPI